MRDAPAGAPAADRGRTASPPAGSTARGPASAAEPAASPAAPPQGPATGLVSAVVPTTGRASLRPLVEALLAAGVPTTVVDDRPAADGPLDLPQGDPALRVVISGGRGPAAARNVGWRTAGSTWIAFLDDDVRVDAAWARALVADLTAAPPGVVAVQGDLQVPPPPGARPTDQQRGTANLAGAPWITADMAVRRDALVLVGGFDERFPRAYREDTDLAMRLVAHGGRITTGSRRATHPLPPPRRFTSLARQRGNADDARMLLHHGLGWRRAGRAPGGRRPLHLAITAAGVAALAARRPRVRRLAAAAWLAGTAELTATRIRQGPGGAAEVADMLLTSPLLPPAATAAWLGGLVTAARHLGGGPGRRHPRGRARAVLLDRDGTLVEDVPYNGDPALVRLRPGAREGMALLAKAGIPTALVTNQRAVGEGWITAEDVAAVNDRTAELLAEAGPLGPAFVCPHRPDDGCGCRKPAPGMVLAAAERLGVDPRDCVLVGDTAADVQAALAAGARAVMVATDVTLRHEVRDAPAVAGDLAAAAELILEARV